MIRLSLVGGRRIESIRLESAARRFGVAVTAQ